MVETMGNSSIKRIIWFLFISWILWDIGDTRDDYGIVLQRGEMSYVNKSVTQAEAHMFIHNRTTKIFNVTMLFKKLTPEWLTVNMKEFLSNEYRQTAISFTRTVEELLESTLFDKEGIVNASEPRISYPLRPNVTYRVINYILHDDSYPALVPKGEYKVELSLLAQDQAIKFFQFDAYGKIQEKVKRHNGKRTGSNFY